MIPRSKFVAVAAVIALAACSSGSDGSQGPQGVKGDQGDPAPGGIISSTQVSATPDPVVVVTRDVGAPTVAICDGLGTGMQFLVSADVLSLAANQRIVASASFDLGTADNGSATGLTLGLCFQDVNTQNGNEGNVILDGTASVGDPGGGTPLQVSSAMRIPFAISRVLTNPAPLGANLKYRVGVCGCVDEDGGAGSWAPGFAQLTVQVIQPTTAPISIP
jgi:hypothetical protein